VQLIDMYRSAICLLILALLGTVVPMPSQAAETAAQVITIAGRANLATAGGQIKALQKGDSVEVGDTVVTGPQAWVRLKFTDDSFTVLRPDTRLLIEDYHLGATAAEDRGVFSLLKGGFRTLTGLIGKRSRERYRFKTAVATIGIRGSDITVRHCADDCQDVPGGAKNGTYLGVSDGAAFMDGGSGPEEYGAGEYGFVPPEGGPAQKIPASQAGPVMGFPDAACGG
jgi:hypothetical protein